MVLFNLVDLIFVVLFLNKSPVYHKRQVLSKCFAFFYDYRIDVSYFVCNLKHNDTQRVESLLTRVNQRKSMSSKPNNNILKKIKR